MSAHATHKTPRHRVNGPGHGHQELALTPDSAYTPGGRRYARFLRLQRLGYKNYRDYLRSSAWAKKKAEFRASGAPLCCGLCGETEQLDIHHLTYDRVGEERLEDLRPLCRGCHRTVHVLDERDQMGLDFEGLVDVERAKRNRTARREREALVRRSYENQADLNRERRALVHYERQLRKAVLKRRTGKIGPCLARYRRCEKRIRWLQDNPHRTLRDRDQEHGAKLGTLATE